VLHEEDIRDYSRNNHVHPSCHQGPGSMLCMNSPVKIGDSFENLKRKMQPFPDIKQQLLFSCDDGAEKCTGEDEKPYETLPSAANIPANDSDTAGIVTECHSPLVTEAYHSTGPIVTEIPSGDATVASPVGMVTVGGSMNTSGRLVVAQSTSSSGSGSNNNNNMISTSGDSLGANVAVAEEEPPLLVLEQSPLVLVQQ
jgi:hypothetical protein